jgi:SAM-dependent methyltransferase
VNSASYWDDQAPTFDEDADHGRRDPEVRRAWRELLAPRLPAGRPRVLDAGCGTGSLAVLLADSGADVVGVDSSPRMIDAARAKAAAEGVDVVLAVGDAADPPVPGPFDVVLCRHVLWALPDPDAAVARWTGLLARDGRLVLVEGRWGTGAGLPADEVRRVVLRHREDAEVLMLTDPALWGRTVEDERYLVLSLR